MMSVRPDPDGSAICSNAVRGVLFWQGFIDLYFRVSTIGYIIAPIPFDCNSDSRVMMSHRRLFYLVAALSALLEVVRLVVYVSVCESGIAGLILGWLANLGTAFIACWLSASLMRPRLTSGYAMGDSGLGK